MNFVNDNVGAVVERGIILKLAKKHTWLSLMADKIRQSLQPVVQNMSFVEADVLLVTF